MDWITDRPPTEADGDSDGDVAVKQRPGSDGRAYLYWSFVKPGMAWRRTDYWAAPEPAAPEPAAPEPTPTAPQPRRIVSIALDADLVAAVADDGSAWWKVAGEATWTQLPALPDRG